MSSTGSSTDNDSGGADHDEDSTGVEPSAAFSAGLEALEQKDLNSSLRDALRSRVLALRSLDPCADGEAGEAEWALGSQAGVCAVTRMVRAGESANVYFSWASWRFCCRSRVAVVLAAEPCSVLCLKMAWLWKQ